MGLEKTAATVALGGSRPMRPTVGEQQLVTAMTAYCVDSPNDSVLVILCNCNTNYVIFEHVSLKNLCTMYRT